MNNVVLMGRLTKDPDIRYTQGEEPMCIARYTLAVDRRYKKDGEQAADFPSCVVFGKGAEFASEYLKKGTKIVISGRLQTGSYVNNEGKKVYTTDVIVDSQEFAESKKADEENNQEDNKSTKDKDGFAPVPEGSDDELPF